jgi:hypothetical protein
MGAKEAKPPEAGEISAFMTLKFWVSRKGDLHKK